MLITCACRGGKFWRPTQGKKKEGKDKILATTSMLNEHQRLKYEQEEKTNVKLYQDN